MTTETSTADISSRFAREKSTSPFRCPAPDGHGGKCLHRLPCYVHGVENERVAFLLYGSLFFVADGDEAPETVQWPPPTMPEGWQPMGYVTDDEPFVDEVLTRYFGLRTVVDPSMPAGMPGLIGIWNTHAWSTRGPRVPYPHPEAARLGRIAPWLTFDADGKVLD